MAQYKSNYSNGQIKDWLTDMFNVCPDELKNDDLAGAFKKLASDGKYVCNVLTECLLILGYTTDDIMKGMKDTIYEYQFDETVFENRIVRIPDNIEIIESLAFNECNIEEVYLGKNIKRLDHACFSDCPNLKEVYIPGAHLERIDGDFIRECPKLELIFIDMAKYSPNFDSVVEQLKNNIRKKKVKVKFSDGTEMEI